MLVGEHLKFNMPRRFDKLLEVHVGTTEGGARLLLCLREHARHFRSLAHNAHAASTAARRRLDDNRIADALRRLDGGIRIFEYAVRPRQNRHAGILHNPSCAILHAHRPDHGGRRPNELDAGDFAHFGETGVFTQESVTRMDGVDIGDLGSRDH